MHFSETGLPALLLNTVQELGYTKTTAIQSEAIPALLTGRDVLATAPTGSGKTAAFCLPILAHYLNHTTSRPTQTTTSQRLTQHLILVPTRELAEQIGEQLLQLSRHFSRHPKLAILLGGVSINPQMLHLRGGADIVIATPGRLLDLCRKNALQLQHVKCLVLDEADRMLALGFADEIAQVFALLPTHLQQAYFSATFADEVLTLAHQRLQNPLEIHINPEQNDTPNITQRAIDVDANARTRLLKHLIQTDQWSRVFVFVATRYAADLVADKLRRAQIRAEAFHGEQSQGKRQQVIHDFKTEKIQVIVATDIAARGIDIQQVPVVVNYDLPRSSDDYLHRIGRTGRAGAQGLAISFICADHANQAHFRLIEKRHRLHIPREQIAGFLPTAISDDAPPIRAQDPNGGIKGKRPNKKDKLRALAARNLSSNEN